VTAAPSACAGHRPDVHQGPGRRGAPQPPHPPFRKTAAPACHDGQVVSITQAAAELGVGISTIYRWLADGFITGEQLTPGAPWRIRLDDTLRAKVTEHAPQGWLPLRQAAAALGVARQTVLHKVQRGELAAVHVRHGRRSGLRIQVNPAKLDSSRTPEEKNAQRAKDAFSVQMIASIRWRSQFGKYRGGLLVLAGRADQHQAQVVAGEELLGLLPGQALIVTTAVPGAGRFAGWSLSIFRACSRSPYSLGLARPNPVTVPSQVQRSSSLDPQYQREWLGQYL
jgi:excisionase family DNA binding protein